MALVVEDGTGIANANVYVSEATFIAYLVEHGLALGTSGDPKAALLRGTTWLDATYRSRYPGSRYRGRDQGLEWPRMNAYDAAGILIPYNEIPTEIQIASMFAAQREWVNPYSLSPDTSGGARIKRKWMSGMGIEYDTTTGTNPPSFSSIDKILSGLLGSVGSSTSSRMIVRA